MRNYEDVQIEIDVLNEEIARLTELKTLREEELKMIVQYDLGKKVRNSYYLDGILYPQNHEPNRNK